jgi:hypothetical protein
MSMVVSAHACMILYSFAYMQDSVLIDRNEYLHLAESYKNRVNIGHHGEDGILNISLRVSANNRQ